MKYSEFLTKIALDGEDMKNVLAQPEVQTALTDYYENGAGQKFKNSVSPQELMRIALGATAGGGTGWLLSRLLHKKPKAWRTALYTLGGATVGGLGTHWYINKKDKNGKSIADPDRRNAMLASPEVQRLVTSYNEAGKGINEDNHNEGSGDSSFLGMNFDTRGLSAGAVGSGVAFGGSGIVSGIVKNTGDARKLRIAAQAIEALNKADEVKKFTQTAARAAKNADPDLVPLKRNGQGAVFFDPKAPVGQRFYVNPKYEASLTPQVNPITGNKKFFSLKGGAIAAPFGFLAGNYIDAWRRRSAYNAAKAQQEEALRLFTSGK